MFNNTPAASSVAQQQCQNYGGNLVSYMSLEEQVGGAGSEPQQGGTALRPPAPPDQLLDSGWSRPAGMPCGLAPPKHAHR